MASSRARFKYIGFPLLGISSKTSVCHETTVDELIDMVKQYAAECREDVLKNECAKCFEAGKALSRAGVPNLFLLVAHLVLTSHLWPPYTSKI